MVSVEKYGTADTREEISSLRASLTELLNKKNAALAELKSEYLNTIEETKKRRREEKERKAAEERRQQKEWERRYRLRKRRKRIAIASCIGVVVLAVAGFFAVRSLIIAPKRYEAAKTALEQGDYEQAASLFEKLGDYEDSKQLLKESYYGLAVGYELEEETYLAATTYGKAAGYEDAWEKSYALWSNFVPKNTWYVDSDDDLVYFIGEEGKIYSVGFGSSSVTSVNDWENVVSIDVSYGGVCALTSEGKVISANSGLQDKVADWESIVQIEIDGYSEIYGLKADGTVVTTNKGGGCNCSGDNIDVSGWKDMRMLSFGSAAAGLKADGSVLFTGFNGNNENNLAEGKYEAVFAVAGGVVARRADGTAALSGTLLRDLDPADCANFISVGGSYAVRSDGTAVYYDYGSLVDDPQEIEGSGFVSVQQNNHGFGLTRSGDIYEFSIEGYTGHYYIGSEKVVSISDFLLPSYPWAD